MNTNTSNGENKYVGLVFNYIQVCEDNTLREYITTQYSIMYHFALGNNVWVHKNSTCKIIIQIT